MELFYYFHAIGVCLTIATMYLSWKHNRIDDYGDPAFFSVSCLVISVTFGSIFFVLLGIASLTEFCKTLRRI
jgi:hypothetical protein